MVVNMSVLSASLLVFVICTAAAAVQGISGIGFSMLVMATMPGVLGYTKAANINRIVGVILPVIALWKYREYIQLRIALIPSVVSLITGTIGIIVFTKTDGSLLQRLLGILLLLFIGWSLFMEKKEIRIAPGPWKGAVIGASAGLLSGLFNVFGPILAIYYIAVSKDSEEYRAAINFNFLILCTWMNCFYQFHTGYTKEELLIAAAGAFGAVCMTLLVYRFFGRLDKKKVSRCLYAVTAVLAFGLLF